MTATEELRRMLDERGVEWSGIGDHTVLWCRRDAKYANYDAQASDWGDKLMLSWACTPEQAIEATLGRGMLTADDVRDLIEQHSCAAGGNGRDFRNGAYVAIADELNSTLGRGTCHVVSSIRHDYEGGYAGTEWEHELSCGHEVWWGNDDPPEWCPHCGRRVVAGDAS